MSEYKGIRGFTVQTVSTDPAASAIAGGTWASGGNLNTARAQAGGAGSQTAGLAFGGSGPPYLTATEEYNGSSWATSPGSLSTARAGLGNAGTQTAALGFGGEDTPSTETTATEEYDGSTWTAGGSLSTLRAHFASAGSQTAALCAGGNGATPTTSAVEEYNGTSWTAGTSLPTAVQFNMGLGLQTAAFSITPTATIEYNGTTWTSVTHLNTGRDRGATSGIVTSALVFNGNIPPNTTVTEFYNGSTWTEVADMATARQDIKSSQPAPALTTLAFGGYSIPAVANVATTEEWTAPSVFSQENLGQVYYNSTANAFKVTKQSITLGTWASGATMNTARSQFSASKSDTGHQVILTGNTPTASVEAYDGTSWSVLTDAPYVTSSGAGFGIKDDFTYAGGLNGTPPTYQSTVSWNGSAWTAGGNINTGRYDVASFGLTGSSGLAAGGTNPAGPIAGDTTNTETYNGTSWTEVNNMNTASRSYSGAGIQTDGISATRGEMIPNAYCEIWNGTSWSESTDLNTPRYIATMAGTSSSSSLCYGGSQPRSATKLTNTEYWNGSSWTELNDISTARDASQGGGTGPTAILPGGSIQGGPATTATEEWTTGTVNSTITVS